MADESDAPRSWIDTVRVSTVFSDVIMAALFYGLAKGQHAIGEGMLGSLLGMWIGYRFGSRNSKRLIATLQGSSLRPPPMPRDWPVRSRDDERDD